MQKSIVQPNMNTLIEQGKAHRGARKREPVGIDCTEYDIDPKRIHEAGKSTLMIKNIPNKYTQDMLLELLDHKVKDTYDFFYLPMDFENLCNMGYAFVNFTDLKALRLFFEQFNGQRWPNFRSNKICKVSYARIQGKEECLAHFKDSSLMRQENVRYRPLVKNSRIKLLVESQKKEKKGQGNN